MRHDRRQSEQALRLECVLILALRSLRIQFEKKGDSVSTGPNLRSNSIDLILTMPNRCLQFPEDRQCLQCSKPQIIRVRCLETEMEERTIIWSSMSNWTHLLLTDSNVCRSGRTTMNRRWEEWSWPVEETRTALKDKGAWRETTARPNRLNQSSNVPVMWRGSTLLG